MNSTNSNSSKCNGELDLRQKVLSAAKDEPLAYFGRVKVKHPRIETVLDDLMVMAQPDTGTDIALLLGPTGVGKTCLTHALRDKILTVHHSEMLEDPSFIPVVWVEAPASGEQAFSWRMFYTRIGVGLSEPHMAAKIQTVHKDGRTSVKPGMTGSTVAGLRVAVENALIHRRTLLIIIDEAVHLLRNCSPIRITTHMDALKSLSNICGVTLALVGSYDLHRLTRLSGQLARRSAIVHMQRYVPGNVADEQAFRKVVRTLQNRLPLEEVPDIEKYSQPLQQACVGCVGILKDTITRALALTVSNKMIWRDEYLERALLSEDQVAAVLEEVLEGEDAISKSVFRFDLSRLSPATSKCER